MFIQGCLAFYGLVSVFATVEAQVVIHTMFPFCEGKTASFLERSASAGGVNLRIWSFLGGDFTDSGIAISVAWWTSIGISWSCVKLPVTIEISSFFDCSCKCGRLRC